MLAERSWLFATLSDQRTTDPLLVRNPPVYTSDATNSSTLSFKRWSKVFEKMRFRKARAVPAHGAIISAVEHPKHPTNKREN